MKWDQDVVHVCSMERFTCVLLLCGISGDIVESQMGHVAVSIPHTSVTLSALCFSLMSHPLLIKFVPSSFWFSVSSERWR